MKELALIALAIWLVSAAALMWQSTLSAILRLVYSVTALPLIALLAWANVILAWKVCPSIMQWLVDAQAHGGATSPATVATAFIVAGSLAAAAFWGWSRILHKIDGLLKVPRKRAA